MEWIKKDAGDFWAYLTYQPYKAFSCRNGREREKKTDIYKEQNNVESLHILWTVKWKKKYESLKLAAWSKLFGGDNEGRNEWVISIHIANKWSERATRV